MTTNLIKTSLKCGCPKCGAHNIFPHRLTLDVIEKCPECGLNVRKMDSGDGPVVFLNFLLCFLFTPLALWVDHVFGIPLWWHVIIWTVACIGSCILTMQPLKAYFMALNYKHRGEKHGV